MRNVIKRMGRMWRPDQDTKKDKENQLDTINQMIENLGT